MAPSEPYTPITRPVKTTRYYGWVIVGICTATIFVVTGTKGTIGALFKDMQKDLNWRRGTTAGAYAISTLAWALTLPLVGPLVDRYGDIIFPKVRMSEITNRTELILTYKSMSNQRIEETETG